MTFATCMSCPWPHQCAERGGCEGDDDPDACTSPRGHRWVYSGTAYGGDDERWSGEGRCYCEWCGADGDA